MTASATLESVLESQTSLLEEAALALPHQFSQCTYSLGHIRQAVYLCLTCTPVSSSNPRGICSACSIACHTDHEQLELFPKRGFRCDCPTSALSHPCTLHTQLEEPNEKNQYGRNFRAQFCRCGRPYDAENEPETMIQCVACEDWFHESCLNLRERPSSREATPAEVESPVEDGASDASSSGLPPPLIRADDYDVLVCSACVRSVHALRRIAGTPGVLMVVRSSEVEPWRIIGKDEDKDKEDTTVDIETKDVTKEQNGAHDSCIPTAGEKRERSASVVVGSEEPQSKKARVSPDAEAAPCLAPSQDVRVMKLLSKLDSPDAAKAEGEERADCFHGAGDVFLSEDWRGRWCRCKNCLPSLRVRPYLLEDEETYEPPEDPDSSLSLEELGMRALQRLPRERAINGIMAFNAMRDELMSHLRPFAERGQEVTEADIRSFFDARIQQIRSSR